MFFKFRRKWRPRPLSQGCAVFLSLLLFRQVAASSPKASKLSPTGAGGLGEVPGASQPGSRCPRSCGNGFCDEERAECVCYPGWRGDECHLCGGKIRLNASKGWLADAVGNYSTSSKCTWLIEAPIDNARIRLHLKEFSTECGWDHLYIFDGDSVFSDLRAVFSGIVRQNRYQVHRVPELVGTSGSMLLHFYSDVAYNMTGFNITFSINDCPSEHHDLTCSGHGSCDPATGLCRCDQDYVGPACSRPACPNNCKERETDIPRGSCVVSEQRCKCFLGWTGESCSQSVSHGYWRVLSSNAPATSFTDPSSSYPTQRTGHAAMVDDFGRMWVVGGETFAWKTRHMVVTYTPPTKEGQSGVWKEIHAQSDKGPSSRYGHSAVIHDQKIYMYGGTMRTGHTSRELWSLDLDLLEWSRVETKTGQCMTSQGGNPKLCGPVHSMGHAACVIANRMIVIFGHSPKYGYLDTVQEYHFGNKEWSIIPTRGYHISGGLGHSATFDEATKLIYVYGGYVPVKTNTAISNMLYSFDPISRIWSRLSPSPSWRYFHSAVISRGMLLVFGGNTHNDTAFSEGAKCYSADFIAYDIRCDRWLEFGESGVPKDFGEDLARFGHTAVTHNGTMLIHGGFNGLLRNDVLSFTPGSCEMYKLRSDCLRAHPGVKCLWDVKRETCVTYTAELHKAGGGVIEACPDTDSSGLRNASDFCSSLRSCASCVSTSGECVWCAGGGNKRGCRWRTCGRTDSLDLKKDSLSTASLSSSPTSSVKSSSLSSRTVTTLDQCASMTSDEWCGRLHSCHACSAQVGCMWSKDKEERCTEVRRKSTNGNLTEDPGNDPVCDTSCSERTDCRNCTEAECMWCLNLNMCVERNSYLASFPYGQCMDWTTDHCPAPTKNATLADNLCSGESTCESCRANPACGWCDDGSLTGVGKCLPGGASAPMTRVARTVHNTAKYEWQKKEDLCPKSDGKSWHFTTCPACQCNGHSSCPNEDGVCAKPCDHNTVGDHCERCAEGYFGNAINGGSCQPCKCNGNAAQCNHKSGRCHCTTKGIVGDHCEKCDKVNHYYGDPVKDSCFYELAIDYQFTFNLSKPDDRHFTGINFKNTPTKADVDVDFQVTCSVPSKLKLTYRYSANRETEEKVIFSEHNCSTMVKERFSKDKFVFGDSENTTFYVYVYDFQPPLWIVISFSQHPKLDLLQFFITFSTCFLALLVVAAVLWKIKQRYDRYRRRQRLFVEMEQMASRPFGSVLVELERLPETGATSLVNIAGSNISPSVTNSPTPVDELTATSTGLVTSATTTTTTTTAGSSTSTTVRKRKSKRYRPSPIALEPCEGNRAAVLSLVVRLPTGGRPYAPPGYTGIAVASSLVTLGTHRKTSADVSSRSMDDPKGRKSRKGPNAQPADI